MNVPVSRLPSSSYTTRSKSAAPAPWATSPFTPLGAKGLGEGGTMSVPVAIANAVADALGVEEVEVPLTPARVWELLPE